MRSRVRNMVAAAIVGFGSLTASAAELLTNGGFETGDFSGWIAAVTGTPLIPWTVSGAGSGTGFSLAATAPQEGVFDAWNGFDGAGPMEFQMYQDVAIPGGSAPLLSWQDRVQWNFVLTDTATAPRAYDVQIRHPGTNAILATLYSFSTGTSHVIGDTGWTTRTADLSAFAGSTVRVFFGEQIPEVFTGPGQIEFDAISLTTVPEPATLALLGLGLAGLAASRRRKATMGTQSFPDHCCY